MQLKKFDKETEEKYIWRLGQAKDNGLVELNWNEIADLINDQFRENGECYDSSAYRKKYQYARAFYEAGIFDNIDHEKQVKELNQLKNDLKIERKKIQTAKLETNKWLRERARDELIIEGIAEAIKTLPVLPDVEIREIPFDSDKTYLLCFGDAHYGIEFELKDFDGGIINRYSPEVFTKRMDELKDKIIAYVKKENISKLNIFELGDGIQGIIRLNSQLLKLRYGIIDSVIRYSEYLANWLNDLSRYVFISFQMVEDSNHNQLRICGAPKNAFSEENMSKVILSFLQERLKENKNIEILTNDTGYAFLRLHLYNILGVHGEINNYEKAIEGFSRSYNTTINYLIGAHCHHRKMEETGINSEAITVGSIIGVDPYGLSLNKTSNPSASLFTFDDIDGKTNEVIFKLH